jgi:hypothetical protein
MVCSNLTGGMDVRVLSGRGQCDELITRPEESYRLWCVVCDIETLLVRMSWSTGGCCAKIKMCSHSGRLVHAALWQFLCVLTSTRLIIRKHKRNTIILRVKVFLRMNTWMLETCRLRQCHERTDHTTLTTCLRQCYERTDHTTLTTRLRQCYERTDHTTLTTSLRQCYERTDHTTLTTSLRQCQAGTARARPSHSTVRAGWFVLCGRSSQSTV